MKPKKVSLPPPSPAEIAVIGGGLGGCLTALMLCKETQADGVTPKYHVTLIEAQDQLMNGACSLAARLHLGGEYPASTKTRKDCLKGAMVWKAVMPDNIYTAAPCMKFLISTPTQNSKATTITEFKKNYDGIRRFYANYIRELKSKFGDDEKKTCDAFFGPYEPEGPNTPSFFKTLKAEEYQDYNLRHPDHADQYGYGDKAPPIKGGIQTPELGLNTPKYLATIQLELDKLERVGRLHIATGHRVVPQGVTGTKGNFNIECKDSEGNKKTYTATQVVAAAWEGNPAIAPLGKTDKGPRSVTVFQRGMMLIGLPEGWKTPPAFMMMGENGGMLAPFNNKVALCYLPLDEAAYIDNVQLQDGRALLPAKWKQIKDPNSPTHKKLRQEYYKQLQIRFPILKDWPLEKANPRLLIEHTLSFQDQLHHRIDQPGRELRGHLSMQPAMEQAAKQLLKHHLELEGEMGQAPEECTPGFFTLYPTKATYAVHAALQITDMVNQRYKSNKKEPVTANKNTLGLLLTGDNWNKYSLKGMESPNHEYLKEFIRNHDNLDERMLLDDWPELEQTTHPRIAGAGGGGMRERFSTYLWTTYFISNPLTAFI